MPEGIFKKEDGVYYNISSQGAFVIYWEFVIASTINNNLKVK